MNPKKLLSVLVAALLMFSVVFQGFGTVALAEAVGESQDAEKNVKISKDDAKKIALSALKDYFKLEIDENLYQFRQELRPDYEVTGGYLWDVAWSMNNNEKSMEIGVSLDANTGKVLGIRKNEYPVGPVKQQVASITFDQGRKIAEDFITSVKPGILSQLKYMDDNYMRLQYGAGYYPANYSYRYARLINGVEFSNNYVSVDVNPVNKSIIAYSSRWDEDLNVPSLDGIVDKASAEQAFKGAVKLQPMYIVVRNPYDYNERITNIKLVYMADFGQSPAVDAKTGKTANIYPQTAQETKVRDLTDSEKQAFYSNYAEVKPLSKEIDKDRAEAVMQNIITDFIGGSYEIVNMRFEKGQNYYETRGKDAWYGTFRNSSSGSMMPDEGQIVIDAATEQLISIYKYDYKGYEEDFQPAITWDGAYTKAIGILGKYCKDKIKDIATEQTYFKNIVYTGTKQIVDPMYSFNFQRVVNGIKFNENGIYVTVDAKTGNIRDMRCTWDDGLNFPDPKNMISPEEAGKVFFEKFKPELTYTNINKSLDYTKPDFETKLIYSLRSEYGMYAPAYIDAVTSKLINYNGMEMTSGANNFVEMIKGNPLEKEMTILAFQGIIDTSTFNVKNEATKLDLVKMLVNARGYQPYLISNSEDLKFTDISKDDANYKFLQLAVKYGIIENKAEKFNGQLKMTREQIAYYIIKATDFKDLAPVKEIFNLPYKDAKTLNPSYFGSVAIAKGLGIMDGTNNLFNPKDYVRMDALAGIIYNSLGYMKQGMY